MSWQSSSGTTTSTPSFCTRVWSTSWSLTKAMSSRRSASKLDSQQPQCKETCNLNAKKPASNYISRWLMSCFGVDTDHCCLHAGCAAVCRIYIMGLSVCLAPSCSMCLAPSRSMCLAPSRSVWVKELSCQKWNQFSQGHYVCRMLCGRSWMT